ncbi:DUF2977 domain-containing protein [Mammaliicoccus sciuri]|uniref:DUF2977 domain-containing protein n=1 Tax=Mammaliicoccus sciuri TaxID=1296 RepID=UPI0028873C41|nr:DUF2977 domain-containing protein [Mammaliicoccus sciuri]MDT0707370.1 DUF2977 domain-containing protein [Mammaliicoccus sciuri]
MKIKVKNDLILSYAIVGNIDDSIEISDNIVPSNFIDDFKPKKYKYVNEQISLNESYQEEQQPVQPPIVNTPGTDEELRKMFASMQVQLVQANMMVMQLSQQNARLSQEMVIINQKLEEVTNNEDVIPEV